jgi:hypothetical protein
MDYRLLGSHLAALIILTGGCKPAGEPIASVTPTRLIGRWVRPDGGYVLAVERVEPDGKVTAQYLNPQPIRVSQAQASVKDGAVQLFVELNDVGYPGCTYLLTYDQATDQLAGTYYQATMRQRYAIAFERMR